ncbi:MAG: DUF1343 domain-containing protein [Erysipelotrichales bacterium]|nr:DUF1343 domain-containing protein [Erysipelotrichales bacterium]
MSKVVLGIERISEFESLFKGKRVGLITNPSGIDSNYVASADIIAEKATLKALFAPEHGVRGDIQAGVKLDSYKDPKTGVIVHSLYGNTRRPTKEMFEDLDIIAYDIHDAGARFYTYPFTMAYCMEAAKEYNKEFVVFDRPNPVGGEKVEGNILDMNFRSFIGYYPITQRYGLTIGEMAKLFNEEYGIGCKLTVVPMKGWQRSMDFEDTGLPWVFLSPNLPTNDSSYAFLATCIFEGTNISEGRGTTKPFQIVGAPFINPELLAEKLNELKLPGVHFRSLYFTPTFSKHQNALCGGVEMYVLDRKKFEPVRTGWNMLYMIRKLYPKEFEVNKPYVEGKPCMLDYNTGSDYMKNDIYTIKELEVILSKESKEFDQIRKKYLLY